MRRKGGNRLGVEFGSESIECIDIAEKEGTERRENLCVE